LPKYSFVGYEPVVKTINLTGDVRLDVELKQDAVGLQEVEVNGIETPVKSLDIGSHNISIETLRKIIKSRFKMVICALPDVLYSICAAVCIPFSAMSLPFFGE